MFIFIIWTNSYCQLKVVSWNLCNFGKSKSQKEIEFIANIIQHADILAIQEVSVSFYGAQAVAKLANELNRKGINWQYAVSNPTDGKGSERYAYLWKPSRVKMVSKPWLEKNLHASIEREPFLSRFEYNGKKILLATIHAIPTSKNPSKECRCLYKIHDQYLKEKLIILGDFNLCQTDCAFQNLRKYGFVSALSGIKTTIKMKPKKGEKFAHDYDNIFYEKSDMICLHSGIMDFTNSFQTLKEARAISDHLPVYMNLNIK